jgi:hypothetical protein
MGTEQRVRHGTQRLVGAGRLGEQLGQLPADEKQSSGHPEEHPANPLRFLGSSPTCWIVAVGRTSTAGELAREGTSGPRPVG